ncbi:NADH dehydrogenase [ubiquinone] iron-sulfur protein 6, mitochondrial [Strongyloides ratti]|uniref:NADH dehydrogenase [ubiquinone] iron-sulfur protein 6, mitochondrial n=1 Tax=Strongyloides ratti TaxID=34506 RepID=A0A090L7A8_STRRB|nr:NADH dehydrogenase [ubiquinone] iron-sulfur protein 6, mitochondrial [Strongyloides ratti]CEF65612.1 NADH dehydrogenase [ubiquinone] iron-sulfur protein 6, mitochondrial [Strongyloides ratti]
MNRTLTKTTPSFFQYFQRFKGSNPKVGLPAPVDINKNNAVFDEKTHTGQAWDQSDYRLQRFHTAEKMVNPNIAMDLIAQVPSTPCEENVVSCDGGHPALGHPKVFINLDKPGNHACGYCGQRFYNTHVTKEEHKNINYISC